MSSSCIAMVVFRLLCVLCLCVRSSLQLTDGFYSYGPSLDASLPKQNDISSHEISLNVPIKFYGESFSSIFVNENGLLSFLTDIPQFFSVQFPLHYPTIAPLYSNVDIGGTGNVFYRETQDPQLLQEATDKVQRYYPNLAAPFTARSIFIATWLEVGYFSRGTDKVLVGYSSRKRLRGARRQVQVAGHHVCQFTVYRVGEGRSTTEAILVVVRELEVKHVAINTFQAVVISDGEESFVEFHYGSGGIQWIQGQPQVSGLPDARAQAGFVSADARLYTLRGSGTDRVGNLDKWSNTETPGFWIFRVGETGDTGNVEPPQTVDSENDDYSRDTTCRTGSTSCHSKAECEDHESGFCCKCLSGYFGNGRNCLKDAIPLRVNGKVSFDLNGVKVSDIAIQAYVVTTDGRSYTALSKIPPVIGKDMQLINTVSNIIGWLFAKPIGEALNGYQITGGFLNNTADLTFSKSNDRVQVQQQFLGLDVFDQLKLEAQISGTIPPLPYNVKLSIPQFQQQFRRDSPGLIKSQGSLTVTSEESTEELVTISIDQSIRYTEYCEAVPPPSTPLRMKSARNFISFEERENILRFASTNKISLLTENDDPCVAGQVTCVNNSVCIPEGDSFRCVCNRGFQTLYTDEGVNDYGCVDINECTTGTHRCDPSALCINEVGSFTCECRPGYLGDGFTCTREREGCDSLSCDRGAECKETVEGAQCVCIAGFMWNGETCIPNPEDDCLACSAQAWCNRTEAGDISCTCLPGYTGDGRYCEPVNVEQSTEQQYDHETARKTCMDNKCWCAPGFREDGELCVRDTRGEDVPTESSSESQHTEPQCLASNICFCPNGYVLHEDNCLPDPGYHTKGQSGNTLTCNEVNMCSPYGQCVESEEQQFQCQCIPGYEGDGIDCQPIEYSCLEHNVCHQYAACIYDDRKARHTCVCNEGYQGDGTECTIADKCNDDFDCGPHSSCSYSEITDIKECICEVGYVQDYGNCIHQGCSECHPDAECTQDPITFATLCKCNSGFEGDGITYCRSKPENCLTADICDTNADCTYDIASSDYVCQCRKGYEGDGKVCEPVKTCYNTPSLCHPAASCHRTQDSYECKCNEGYVGNGISCKEIRPQNGGFLLVSKEIAIVQMPFQPTSSRPGRPIQISYDQIAIAVTIDCVDGRVYWSDIGGQLIKSSYYDGKDSVEFINSDINSPEGLAVDWINRNLYWTDSGSDTINFANLDNGEPHTIVSTGLVNPRGIAVHPGKRKVFWSDWNRAGPKLEWSWLDGSGRTVLVQDKTVHLPNSLAIDFDQEELCWTDAGTKNIECIGIENGLRRTVVSNCSYPFGLAITQDKYYWTDWNTQKVESAWKHTGASAGSLVVPPGKAGRLYGIAAVNDNCPRQ